MGRQYVNKVRRDFPKGRQAEATCFKVSLLHVDVPDAYLRLEQALEFLLEGNPSPQDPAEEQNLRREQNMKRQPLETQYDNTKTRST